jgi:hypothetical protein
MSRAYRVRWTSVSSENMSLNVSLLGILSDDEMTALLRDQLAADGWTREKDGSMRIAVEGTEATLGADGHTVTVGASKSKESETWLDEDYSQELKDSRMATAKQTAEKSLQGELLRQLERAEPEVRAKLDTAVQRVYIEALKKKAASMGEIESLQEQRGEDGAYEITIKVRA